MANKMIVVETKQVKSLCLELKGFEKEAQEATYHALKRTMSFFVAEAGRQVTAKYAVKKSEVKDSFKPYNPTKKNLSAGFESTGYTLSMAHFPHTPSTLKTGKYKVKVAIFKGRKQVFNGCNEAAPYVGPTGAKSPDKVQNNIFQRRGTFSVMQKGRYKGNKREDIIVPRTLSIPQMLGNEGVSENVTSAALEVFNKRLEHELERAFEKTAKEVSK